ncbi:hypothetical protein DI005_18375 [Prauserella sp. PE36]|nr:hypothetical protein DI005_18375 [Prauserella sp. PE36]
MTELTAADLLGHARRILESAGDLPQATRLAAVLARQSLEDAVHRLLTSFGYDLSRANMRSRLISLQVLMREKDGVPKIAALAWNGLSHLCHHHAYELTPTVGEVRHLMDQVDAVVRSVRPSRLGESW